MAAEAKMEADADGDAVPEVFMPAQLVEEMIVLNEIVVAAPVLSTALFRLMVTGDDGVVPAMA